MRADRSGRCVLLLAALASGCASTVVGRGTDSGRMDAGTDTLLRDVLERSHDAVSVDAFTDVSDASAHCTAPRPIAPLSTSFVTTDHPMLRWTVPVAGIVTQLELCPDRECTVAVRATTTSLQFDTLAARVGTNFWRVGRRCGDGSLAFGPTWEFHVPVHSAPLDTTWGTIPDIDGDGHPELLTGSYLTSVGRVYHGGPSGLSATRVTRIGVSNGSRPVVMSAGDVNGDGLGDVLAFEGGAPPGVVRVFYGSTTGLVFEHGTTLDGPVGAQFGLSLSAVGDVDRDGYGDVIVGAPVTVSSMPGMDAAWLFRGGPDGMAPAPIEIRGMVGTRFGQTVASAGDINGDGIGDALVAQGYGPEVFLYRGSFVGLETRPAATFVGSISSSFGYNISLAGDLDGDGYSDIAIGSTALGNVRLFHGSALGPDPNEPMQSTAAGITGGAIAMAGDVNGDGFGDLIVGASDYSDGSNGFATVALGAPRTGMLRTFRVPSPMGARGFGWSVAGGADYDDDGYADYVVGALGSDRSYVYRGGPGLSAGAPWLEVDGGEL